MPDRAFGAVWADKTLQPDDLIRPFVRGGFFPGKGWLSTFVHCTSHDLLDLNSELNLQQ